MTELSMNDMSENEIFKKETIKSAIDPPNAIDEETSAKEATGLPGITEQKAVIKPLAADLGNVGRATAGLPNITEKEVVSKPTIADIGRFGNVERVVVPGLAGPSIDEPYVVNPGIGQLLNPFVRGGWTDPKDTPDNYGTSHGPTLAAFDSKLYMAWKGIERDTGIWYSYYDGNKWKDTRTNLAEKHQNFQTSCGPALAVLDGKLFLAWKHSNSARIYISWTSDGLEWKMPIDTGKTSTHGPALAFYKGRLYMVWKQSNGEQVMLANISKISDNPPGLSWSREVGTIANSSHGPSLAVFNDLLYMVWKGSKDEDIWYSLFHESKWMDAKNLRNLGVKTSCGPALATFAKYWEHAKGYDPIHKDLYMVWKGSGSDNNIHQSTFRLNELEEEWTPQVSISSRVQTSDTPALAEFNKGLYMAWKGANNSRIHFSQLDIGYNDVRNIFDKSRPGIPVVRPEDLAVFRIETRNMTVVSGAVIGYNPNNYNIDYQIIKEKVNVKVVLLSSLAEIKTPSRLETLPTANETAKLKETADKLKEAGVEVVFCSAGINEDTIAFFAKEGITVLHNVTRAEMNELAIATGATINRSIEDWTASRIVGTVGRFEVAQPGGGMTYIPSIAKPRLQRKNTTGDAYLILHLPPQSFGEETFFQTKPPNDGFTDKPLDPPKPSGSTEPCTPPIKARIAHESRLVFKVPNGFPDIEYTLEGVLKACKKLELKVSIADLPELPDATTTSIEMPWRLILTPNIDSVTKKGAYWRHADLPVLSGSTNHTELWHTQMVTPHFDGEKIIKEIMSPYPDEKRTTRATWALSGMGDEIATAHGKPTSMQSIVPKSDDLPDCAIIPFRMPLDNFDRYSIAHLTSNKGLTDGTNPVTLDTKMLMLSSLGGWLDVRGAWDVAGISIEQWSHRATMGRDHFVRVVYRGFLCPFGHRVSLIKVSERKFNKTGSNDYAAYLHQRLYMVINEKERDFTGNDSLFSNAKTINEKHSIARKFPFKSIRLLTEVTPDLSPPETRDVSETVDGTKVNLGQKMFWPHVGSAPNAKPFRFQCAAIDLEGRRVLFDLPMIFVDSTKALPRAGENLDVLDYGRAETNAQIAMKAFVNTANVFDLNYNTADLDLQRVALARNSKPGDTSVQVKKMQFGGFAEEENTTLRNFSKGLTRPLWVPQVDFIEARIESIAHLSGAQGTHILKFNDKYLRNGLGKDNDADADVEINNGVKQYNKGEVFVNINTGGPNLDFSSQGDKSGGFIQPNLTPAALSRLAGPVMGDETQLKSFITGTMSAGAGFPESDNGSGLPNGLPMPLLFGCIPLGKLIKEVNFANEGLKGIPKFISEAGSKVDSFFSELGRLYELSSGIPEQLVNIAKAALTAFNFTFQDIKEQALAFTSAQQTLINGAIDPMIIKNNEIINSTDFGDLNSKLNGFIARVNALENAVSNPPGNILPAGFKQSVLNTAIKLKELFTQLEQMIALLDLCYELNTTLSKIKDPDTLKTHLNDLKAKINSLKAKIQTFDLLDGAPRNVILSALKAVMEILEMSNLLEMLTGDELTVRFDWNPEIKNWSLDGSDVLKNQLFRANDKKGLLVSVEAKVKKNGASSPNISVNCSLKHFDLGIVTK